MTQENKPVIISISSQQSDLAASEAHPIEFVTPGWMRTEDGRHVVFYEESELTGLAGTQTMLFVEPNKVILSRQGAVHTCMVFENGRRHLSYYDTSEGALTVGVNTRSIVSQFTEAGGQIHMRYRVDIEGSYTSETRVQVKVHGCDTGAPAEPPFDRTPLS